MVLDVANLDIKPGLEPEFEKAFDVAQKIISSMPGYVSHELSRKQQPLYPVGELGDAEGPHGRVSWIAAVSGVACVAARFLRSVFAGAAL